MPLKSEVMEPKISSFWKSALACSLVIGFATMVLLIVSMIVAQFTNTEYELGYMNHGYVWGILSALLIAATCFSVAMVGRLVFVLCKQLFGSESLESNLSIDDDDAHYD